MRKSASATSLMIVIVMSACQLLSACQRSTPSPPVGLVTGLVSNFDRGTLSAQITDSTGTHDAIWELEACCKDSIRTVESPVKPGYSARFEQRCGDEPVFNGRRSEFRLRLGSLHGRTQIYGFRVFLPPDWNAGLTSQPVTVAQWHELPDLELGEDWRISPLALQLRDGQWAVTVTHDAAPKTTLGDAMRNVRVHMLGPFAPDVGRWISWRFRVTWSPDAAGSLEVWKQETAVLRDSSPIGYNDRDGPYFKAGVYRAASPECPLTVLMDDFSFHDEGG